MSQAELSPEQVAELKQAFEMFDRDQGGSINTKELGCTMRAMGMNPTEAEILDLLNEFDTDSNGTIEFPEFCSMMSGRMLAGHDLDTVRMTFRALDISGSGRISCKQFKYLITNIGDKLSEQEAEDLLADVDKNRDGAISFREFVSMLSEESHEQAEEGKQVQTT